MGGHEEALLGGLQSDFKKVPAVQADDRPTVGADVGDSRQPLLYYFRRLESGYQKQVVDLSYLLAPAIDITDLGGEKRTGLACRSAGLGIGRDSADVFPSRRNCRFKRNRPSSAGSSFSFSSSSQPGWVKSPEPITPMPLIRAQASKCSGVSCGLVEIE